MRINVEGFRLPASSPWKYGSSRDLIHSDKSSTVWSQGKTIGKLSQLVCRSSFTCCYVYATEITESMDRETKTPGERATKLIKL